MDTDGETAGHTRSQRCANQANAVRAGGGRYRSATTAARHTKDAKNTFCPTILAMRR